MIRSFQGFRQFFLGQNIHKRKSKIGVAEQLTYVAMYELDSLMIIRCNAMQCHSRTLAVWSESSQILFASHPQNMTDFV
jgi:hypothetical protein